MRKIASRFLVPVIAGIIILGPHTILAGSATWKLNPSNGNWNTASHWTPATVPSGPSDTATFASSNITNASFSANTQVNGIVFNAAASPFTISAGGVGANFTFTISGVGIANNSAATQSFFVGQDENFNPAQITFINNATAGQNTLFTVDGGSLQFQNGSSAQGATLITRNNSGIYFSNTSSASSASITNEGGTSSFSGFGGYTYFEDSATAGSAMIVNNAQQTGGATGGQVGFLGTSSAGTGRFVNHGGGAFLHGGDLAFTDSSTAGNAIFLNEGGMGDVASGASIEFDSDATAGSAVITTNGAASTNADGAFTGFFADSTAGASTLIANGGSNGGPGGLILFENSNSSPSSTSQIRVFGNGSFDISLHEIPGMTVGSLGGSGLVFLGANNLTVGSNNLSTVFSGLMRDGGVFSTDTGGSLSKIGTATLRLSGANTYTGGTIVNAGRLMANNSTGSATSTASVVVNNNSSVLGGTGRVAGPVTINTNAAILGGDATMASGALSVANNLTLSPGSIIQLVLGPSGAHTSLARTGGAWTFAPNQKFTFLDLSAQAGVYDNIITGLSSDPGGTASWTINNAGFVGTFAYDGAGNIDLNLTAVSTPLQLTSAVSRKTHGGAGDFDIPLPLTGEPGVECRNSGGNHTLVFTFNNNVVGCNASVTSGVAAVPGNPTFAGNTMTVNLTGVADIQKITVTLSNVTDSFSQVLPDKAVSVNMLVGDTSGNKTVNGTDVSQTKLQSGSPVTAANFREDVNVNGSVNGTDVSIVKLRSGSGLP